MPIPFADNAARVHQHLEQDWSIPIIERDIPDPLTGDLNGAEIDIDYAVTPEQRLFLLGHLFGHTVQWNVNESAFNLGRQYKPPVDEKLIPEVLAYEGEAARYGLQMLHQIGITDPEVDQWFSNYTAADQAYLLLRVIFVVAPIVAGIDKFADVLTDWDQYLAPWINDILPGTAQQAMHVIWVVEIAAGLLVLVIPRYGALVVAAWLGGIVFNLLTYSGNYDIAQRDFGLMIGALALWRLSAERQHT